MLPDIGGSYGHNCHLGGIAGLPENKCKEQKEGNLESKVLNHGWEGFRGLAVCWREARRQRTQRGKRPREEIGLLKPPLPIMGKDKAGLVKRQVSGCVWSKGLNHG